MVAVSSYKGTLIINACKTTKAWLRVIHSVHFNRARQCDLKEGKVGLGCSFCSFLRSIAQKWLHLSHAVVVRLCVHEFKTVTLTLEMAESCVVLQYSTLACKLNSYNAKIWSTPRGTQYHTDIMYMIAYLRITKYPWGLWF